MPNVIKIREGVESDGELVGLWRVAPTVCKSNKPDTSVYHALLYLVCLILISNFNIRIYSP